MLAYDKIKPWKNQVAGISYVIIVLNFTFIEWNQQDDAKIDDL